MAYLPLNKPALFHLGVFSHLIALCGLDQHPGQDRIVPDRASPHGYPAKREGEYDCVEERVWLAGWYMTFTDNMGSGEAVYSNSSQELSP